MFPLSAEVQPAATSVQLYPLILLSSKVLTKEMQNAVSCESCRERRYDTVEFRIERGTFSLPKSRKPVVYSASSLYVRCSIKRTLHRRTYVSPTFVIHQI